MSLRFYCPAPPRAGLYQLPPEEAKHLVRVCRKQTGDRVELFDGTGFTTAARIVEMGKDKVLLVAEGPPIPEPATSIRLVLASAIPKGERFDWLIEKATELGVDRFIPLLTERSAVDPRDAKLARMNRIIIESCKQSGRSRLMCVEPAIAWSSLVRSAAGGVRLIAVPDGLVPSRWPRLAGNAGLILAVGPEGGFTQEEEDEAGAAGWHPIQLATNVLRIETAAIAGSAAVMAICREHQTDERN